MELVNLSINDWHQAEQWRTIFIELSNEFGRPANWLEFNVHSNKIYGFEVESEPNCWSKLKISITNQKKFILFTFKWGDRLFDPAVEI